MDGTPEYLYDAEHVIPRVVASGAFNRDATRFIAILREPVSRDWSMFRMLKAGFWPKEQPLPSQWFARSGFTKLARSLSEDKIT